MTTRVTEATLTASGPATPIPIPTPTDLLRTIARMFGQQPGKFYAAIQDVEGLAMDTLKACPTTGTVLEPVVDTLNAANVPTDPNIGSVIENLDLTHTETHDLVCACCGANPTGQQLQDRFSELADRKG